MIKIVQGDLLAAPETYLVHQVNCMGIMSEGFALQIRNKYPDVYRRYVEYCDEHLAKHLLGRVLLIPTDDGKIICNVFSSGNNHFITDYAALSKALSSLKNIVPKEEALAFPYKIGCGIGRGNWSYIEKIIEDIFNDRDIIFYSI